MGKSGLTFAQRRLLERMIANPGSAVSIFSKGEAGGYDKVPSFCGRFHHRPCRTCGHHRSEPVSWLVIHALSEAGYIAERMKGSDYFLSEDITPAGHAALRQQARAA